MPSSVKVNPQTLRDASAKIESEAATYQQKFNQLFSEVEAMERAWQGADNVAFTSQIAGFREDFEAMHNLMIQYSGFLKGAANTYQSTQDDIVSGAKKLSN